MSAISAQLTKLSCSHLHHMMLYGQRTSRRYSGGAVQAAEPCCCQLAPTALRRIITAPDACPCSAPLTISNVLTAAEALSAGTCAGQQKGGSAMVFSVGVDDKSSYLHPLHHSGSAGGTL